MQKRNAAGGVVRRAALFGVARSVLASVLLLAFVPALATAAPSTPAIREKQAEAEKARRALDDMTADLELVVEEYNAVTEALEITRGRIVQTREDLADAQRALAEARGQLSRRAAGIYKAGPVAAVDVLLGTRTFTDFITRMDLLMRINRRDAESVAVVKQAKARVEEAEAALEVREAEQIALRDRAQVKKREVEAQIARQEEYVATIGAEVKRLMAEEAARQKRLAEERARRAAELARSSRGRAFDEAGLGAGRSEVVDVGLRYLGVPYVWGGTTPAGFDCSGLTSYCYRQIGIEIPRTSASQFGAGAHIPPDRLDLLVPGDLVFFGRDGDPGRVHHVGIYVGDGNFLHAPQRGDVVRVSSLTERIAERGDYVGASRF